MTLKRRGGDSLGGLADPTGGSGVPLLLLHPSLLPVAESLGYGFLTFHASNDLCPLFHLLSTQFLESEIKEKYIP